MIVSNEQFDERMAICNECEHFTSGSGCDRLQIFMPTNARLENTLCPEHKWPKPIPSPAAKVQADTPPQKDSSNVDLVDGLDASPPAAEAATDIQILDGSEDETS